MVRRIFTTLAVAAVLAGAVRYGGSALGAVLASRGETAPLTPAGLLQPAAASSATRLAANVLAGLPLLATTGSPAATTPIHIAIGLRDRDPAGIAALLRQVDDPHSAQYHQFLTPQQFAARFGPDPSTYAGVLDWLRQGGFAVVETSTSRDYVQAIGTVRAADALFHTTIETFTSHGQTFYANTSAPQVPANFDIISVIGLNDLQRFHTFTQDTPAHPAAPHGAPGAFQTGSLTAQQLWSIYDQPDENKGQGQTMAIFAAGTSDATVSNLRGFEQMENLPPVPVHTTYVGAGPFADISADDVEWALDTQASTGMAPLVQREDMYFGATLSDADVSAVFNRWADDNIDKQASASYGECETTPLDQYSRSGPVSFGNNLEPVAEQTLARANLQGQTLFASTGDTGSFCPTVGLALNGVTYTGDPRLNYPAASPHVVAVGGSVLYSDGSNPPGRGLEYAWPYTGGGSSVFLPAPGFQQADGHVVGRCGSDNSGGTGATGQLCRGIPDVAAESGDLATSNYKYYQGGPSVQGGTSLSSPLWLGMWTRIQAAAPNQAKGNGFADPVLYAIGGDAGKAARDFYDVQNGGNGLYTALPGWDYVSGWGTPDVKNLMLDIDGKTAPTNNTLPSTPAAGAPGTAALAASGAISCGPLWTKQPTTVTGPTGDQETQLELLAGQMALSGDGSTLQVTLTLVDAEPTVPPGATGDSWQMSWSSGGTTYYAQAFLNLAGTISYSDGTVSGSTNQGAHSDTGKFTAGKNGTVEIDVPLGNVKAAIGGVLGQAAGATSRFIGDPLGDGLNQAADSGGPQHDFAVEPASTCVPAAARLAPAPSAPTASAAPSSPSAPGSVAGSNPVSSGGTSGTSTPLGAPASGTATPAVGSPAPTASPTTGAAGGTSSSPRDGGSPSPATAPFWESPWLLGPLLLLGVVVIVRRIARQLSPV